MRIWPVVFAADLLGVRAMAQGTPQRTSPAPVTIPFTEVRPFKSTHVGADYHVRIRLPENYESTSTRYPVIYLLDGDYQFAMVTDIVRYLEWGGLVPQLIVVAPSYGSTRGAESGGANMRNRDYSVFPAQAGYVPGGGERFLEFMRRELIPHIDSEFRTDSSDRTLIGYSRGADLVVYTLFTVPEAFQRYVALDNYYPEYLQLEEAFAARGRDLPKKVFMSSRYPNGGLHALSEKLKARGHVGLTLDYVDGNARHLAFPGEGLTRALTSIFNRKSVLEALLPIATRGPIDSVIAEHRRLRRSEESWYDWREAELTDLGNALLQMNRPSDAVRIFQLNLESYPKSANIFRRLGASYERLGDREKAIESYRQVLQIAQNDPAATAALRRLGAER